MAGRQEVADFWDDYLRRWLEGDETLHDPLDRWFSGYAGPLDLECYPDPFAGDLRGERSEPRIVVLGINPGQAHRELQARGGIWAERVRAMGFSHCFQRSTEEDPENWRRFHGRRSRYWERVMPFCAAWVDDATIGDVLAMELYPWHSRRKQGGVETPADLARRFVFEPIAELEVGHVFSFSKPWLEVAERLGLRQVHPREVLSQNKAGHVLSTVSVFELGGGQQLVASTNANGFPLSRDNELGRLLEILEAIA